METCSLTRDPWGRGWSQAAPGATLVHGTHLTRADLDVEVAPLIGNFEDLRPGKAVDPQPVPVDEEAIGADTQHDVDTL